MLWLSMMKIYSKMKRSNNAKLIVSFKSSTINEFCVWFLCCCIASFCATVVCVNLALASTKPPVPRFVTTKSNEVNARKGPGVRYPTEWVFIKKGEPIEITTEFDQWRYITDVKGEGGWVHSSVLSGKRSVIIKSKNIEPLRKSADKTSRVIAKLSPNLRCAFKVCKKDWCKIDCQSNSGWIEKKHLWGVYPED